MGLTMVERKAVTKETVARYLRASKKGKGRILDELCALTGWNRDHARRALRQAAGGPKPRKPRRQALVYGPELTAPLAKVWATLDGPCGKRLAPFMEEIVGVLQRFGELELGPRERELLLCMSAATIDRRLKGARRGLELKGRSGTKPGTMLKHQIAIRTFAEWDEDRPGFLEIDLVGHEGGNPSGDFCQSLDMTDVATGWTEVRAVKNKAQRWVFEALQAAQADLPFPLAGIDSDNGSEFINDELYRYCTQRAITFTRSRPHRKNDSCYVEQKNWSVVRRAVGYLRYDTDAELAVLQDLYGHLRLWVNFFSPQMKLKDKTRQGARVTKHYDVARTPYQRVLASSEVSANAKAPLTRQYRTLNPAQLKRDIGRCQDRLLKQAKLKEDRRRKEVRSATASRALSVRQRSPRSRAS